MIKGPKGIGSFWFFISVSNRNMDIREPKTKDNKMFSSTRYGPSISPKDAINSKSPSPIPPLDTSRINKKINPPTKAPLK